MKNNHRISIYLSEEEMNALKILAEQKRRDIHNQASIMVRRCLEEDGMIPWHPAGPILATMPAESLDTQEDVQEGTLDRLVRLVNSSEE